MSTLSLSRLSPYNIADDLLRPELIAYRHYGSDALKWVILIAAGMDNMRDAMDEE